MHTSPCRLSNRARLMLMLMLMALALCACPLASAAERGLDGAYTDPTYFTKIPFGAHSHWLQPWRASFETVPAQAFVNGIGICLDVNTNPALVVHMLAKNGIRHGRIEIDWGNIDWNDEGTLSNPGRFQPVLQACKNEKVRPLILLNAHHGVPGPTQQFMRTVTAPAAQGSRQVQLNDVSGLVIGRSGFSKLTDYWAAEVLITAVSGNTVTLSRPLPVDLPVGDTAMATLKYRPFSVPGSADYNETIAGWKRYVSTVGAYVAATLGTVGKGDLGFDMEIWNEMSFGFNFVGLQDSVWVG